MLLALISDDIGINTTGNGIGHDILAVLDENTESAVVLNDYYHSDINTFKSGKVLYPFSKIAEGTHTLTLKAWDISNNSAMAATSFIVFNADNFRIDNLMNYPNPVEDGTTFTFQHNQPGEDLDVSIEIFDLMGKKIKTLQAIINDDGTRSEGIYWDASTDGGSNIARGMYVYNLTVKNPEGKALIKSNRLMILK